MTHPDWTTVAALQFARRPGPTFTQIVAAFDACFHEDGPHEYRLTRDGADIAIFDRQAVRIALAWAEPEIVGQPWYLILAVGRPPDAASYAQAHAVTPEFCNRLSAHILERIKTELPSEAIYRSASARALTTDLLDSIAEHLLLSKVHRPPARPPAPSVWTDFKRPDLSKSYGAIREDEQMKSLREAICGAKPDTEITLPLHLSIYALGASMLIQAPPVGAALLVYTMLREDFMSGT